MRNAAIIAAAVLFVLPTAAQGDPESRDDPGASVPAPLVLERDGAPSNHRDSARVLLLGGVGLPQLVNVEADVAVVRGLAITGRAGMFPPLFFSASAGVLGLVPLSLDTGVVPRHALALGAEWTTMAVPPINGANKTSERYGTFVTQTSALLSTGYLYTSDGGFHFRVIAGVLTPFNLNPLPPIDLRIAFGGLL